MTSEFVDTLEIYDFADNLEIHEAAFYGNVHTLREILQAGIECINSCNVDGNTPLMMALYGPFKKLKLKVIELLIKYGADINMINKKGDSALHAAVYGVINNKVGLSCVERLLNSGIDMRITNLRGKTATQIAFDQNQRKLVNFLLYYSDKKIEEQSRVKRAFSLRIKPSFYDITSRRRDTT